MLVVGTLFIPLVQLLFQLLIVLGESLNCRDEGLHLPFQGVGGVSGLLDDDKSRLDHATLCFRSDDTANHLFPIDDAN